VLQGAVALAVPTIPGQEMSVRVLEGTGVLVWRSYYGDHCWFEAEFSVSEMNIISASDKNTAEFLQQLLRAAMIMNPEHLIDAKSYMIETILGFHPEWGLGSSSSLINLLADWFRIDPFELFKKTQRGSGYDITCARVLNPIWFRLMIGTPIAQKVNFNPEFKESLAFVYSGRKQDSAVSVENFGAGAGLYEQERKRISEISRELPLVKSLSEFNSLIDEHEEIISGILDLPKVKDDRFPDFPGSIKSLGAWGGDFLLASSEIGYNEIKTYFSKEGLDIVFAFDEMVLGVK